MATYADMLDIKNGNLQSQHKRDVWPSLISIKPNRYPFINLLSSVPTRSVDNQKFELYEIDKYPEWVKTAATYATATTTIKLVDPAGNNVGQALREDDLFRIGNEIVRVTTTSGASTTVVERGDASTTATTHATGTYAVYLGTARKGGSTYRDATSIIPTAKYNYIQTFEDSWGVTFEERNTANYTGDTFYAKSV